MQTLEKSLEALDKSLSVLRLNPYLSGIITLFLVVYAGLAAPALPYGLTKIFDYSIVKIIMLTLILVFLSVHNIGVAVVLATIFIISMNSLNTHKLYNHMADVPAFDASLETVIPGENSKVTWNLHDGVNTINLKGEVYVSKDVENLLPGGHGRGLASP